MIRSIKHLLKSHDVNTVLSTKTTRKNTTEILSYVRIGLIFGIDSANAFFLDFDRGAFPCGLLFLVPTTSQPPFVAVAIFSVPVKFQRKRAYTLWHPPSLRLPMLNTQRYKTLFQTLSYQTAHAVKLTRYPALSIADQMKAHETSLSL